jgi:hypothetical protein
MRNLASENRRLLRRTARFSLSRNPVILAQTAAAYALAGRPDKARAMLPAIEGQARERYVCRLSP